MSFTRWSFLFAVALSIGAAFGCTGKGPRAAVDVPSQVSEPGGAGPVVDPVAKTEPAPTFVTEPDVTQPRPIAPFVEKALTWLVEAQHPDGGWGAGSHANQQERNPSQVATDPATTAFTAMALLRAGHTPTAGDYRGAVRRATEYLVSAIERAPEVGPKITDLEGTQPQSKLGQIVDTSMAANFLAKVLPLYPDADALRPRVSAALDKCLAKLQGSQKTDGSWTTSGWATVLQSSMSCSALEFAQVAGKQVDAEALTKARDFQKGNFDRATGAVKADTAAGVDLYAFAASQRATAGEARAADEVIAAAKSAGTLDASATVTEDNLVKAGMSAPQASTLNRAFEMNGAQIAGMNNEQLLSGFGNNGGEEYLSHMMTSESLVITGGEPWQLWNDKMHERLAKVQSPDGSWTGHHCITSPVFCTDRKSVV